MAVIQRNDTALRRLAAAGQTQLVTAVAWLRTLDPRDGERPSIRRGTTVADIIRHMLLDLTEITQTLNRPTTARPATLATHLRARRSAAPHMQQLTRSTLGLEQMPDLIRQLDRLTDDVEDILSDQLPETVDSLYAPVRPTDYLRAVCIELVGHCVDLSAAVPEHESLEIHEPALTEAVRGLAQVIASQHPGRSIELRIPPAAAVQIGDGGPGPTHTRGTPPSVVETDPLTLLKLCTDRVSWQEALVANLVSASGAHADLSDVFPL